MQPCQHPGHVRIWINGNMQANTNAYIGRNDAPERGGSGMYHKFGIYRDQFRRTDQFTIQKC